MNWVFEVVCAGPVAAIYDVNAWFDAAAQDWITLPGLTALDAYRPEEGASDPFNDDRNGPLIIAMLAFGARDTLMAAVKDAAGGDHLVRFTPGLETTATGMERRFYPVAGESAPGPLQAPFSYVVRYHRPAADESAFVANYVATHPPTLATLPGIRSVLCYFPIAEAVSEALAPADYMIGNEVVFDDVAAFNLAMQSPVRQELRAHFREFPPFTGRNTHYPMRRTRLTG